MDPEDQEPEAAPEKDPRDAEIAQLKKELTESKTWAHKEAATRLSSQLGVEIDPDDLKKPGALQLLEKYLPQVSAKAPETEPPAETTEPEKPEVPILATAANLNGPPGVAPNRISFAEAEAKLNKGEMSWGEIREKIAAGLVDGVKTPTGTGH